VAIYGFQNGVCACVFEPAASYLHGAVSTDEWLLIVGGVGVTGDTVARLSLYHYNCSYWTDLTPPSSGQSSRVFIVLTLDFSGNFLPPPFPSPLSSLHPNCG